MDITILGIESSCDDTSAAVIRNTTLLSNVIASQEVHRKYGGVFLSWLRVLTNKILFPLFRKRSKEQV